MSTNVPLVTVTPIQMHKNRASYQNNYCCHLTTSVDEVTKVLFKPTYKRAVHPGWVTYISKGITHTTSNQ